MSLDDEARHPPQAVTIPAAGQDASDGTPRPLGLPRLAASVALIVIGAVAIASLLAVLVVLALYARLGVDGLRELYADLRFDLELKTEVGAVVVGVFYASVAAATLAVSRWVGGVHWRTLIAWRPPRGRTRTVLAIFVATLAYGIAATTLLTSMQHRPVINVNGPTNFILLGTFVTNLVVMAPCAEELFFRGWLFTGLRRQLPFWPTLLTTSTLFAAIHMELHRPRVLLVLPLAIAVGFVRELADSVRPAIALHVTYNLVIVTVRLWEI